MGHTICSSAAVIRLLAKELRFEWWAWRSTINSDLREVNTSNDLYHQTRGAKGGEAVSIEEYFALVKALTLVIWMTCLVRGTPSARGSVGGLFRTSRL